MLNKLKKYTKMNRQTLRLIDSTKLEYCLSRVLKNISSYYFYIAYLALKKQECID